MLYVKYFNRNQFGLNTKLIGRATLTGSVDNTAQQSTQTIIYNWRWPCVAETCRRIYMEVWAEWWFDQ
jgi:hypothetical protein